tara:strand:- start:1745 stop:1891 length:147 start_codon:yes stop_codon:yes gene_type:complete
MKYVDIFYTEVAVDLPSPAHTGEGKSKHPIKIFRFIISHNSKKKYLTG